MKVSAKNKKGILYLPNRYATSMIWYKSNF